MPHSSQEKTSLIIALSLLVILGMVWGSGYVIAKLATTNGVPPLGYSFWQSLGPAIAISLVTLSRGKALPLSARHIRYYFICGLIGIAVPNSIMYFSASHMPTGLLSVIVNIAPIATYAIALLAKQERFDSRRLFGVCLGVVGIMLVILPHASLPSHKELPWALLTLLTPLSFAACAVFIAAQRLPAGDSLTQAAGMLLASTILLTPVVLGTGNFYWLHIPLHYADWLILLEILLSSCGYVIMFKLLQLAGPGYYSMVSGVVMLTGLGWGYGIFGEKLTLTAACAVLLILFGIALVSSRHANRLPQNLVDAKPQKE